MLTPSRFLPEKDTFLKLKSTSLNIENCLHMLENEFYEHIGHNAVEKFINYREVLVLGSHYPIHNMNCQNQKGFLFSLCNLHQLDISLVPHNCNNLNYT